MVFKAGTYSASWAAELVTSADKATDPFHSSPGQLKYEAGGLSLHIEHNKTRDLPQNVVKWATDLTKSNMFSFYDATWGWSTKDKLKELGHAKGRHLVAYAVEASGERRPVAYLHYRWELDPPKEERRKGQRVYAVAYVYELQLAEDARGKGLGSHLMSLLETRASRQGMHKVMLTCFTSNTGAQRLYRKLGYSKDETSPDPEVDGPEFAGYDILSKRL